MRHYLVREALSRADSGELPFLDAIDEALKLEDYSNSMVKSSEHYGFYGTACINTGQFDAGECWKCEIKRLRKERDEAKDRAAALEAGCSTPSTVHGDVHVTCSRAACCWTEEIKRLKSERDNAREEVINMIKDSWNE
jgi:hypothetical protein